MKADKNFKQVVMIHNVVLGLLSGKGTIPEDSHEKKAFIQLRQFFNKTIFKEGIEAHNEALSTLELDHASEINGKVVPKTGGGYEKNKVDETNFQAALKLLPAKIVSLNYDREKMDWNEILLLLPESLRNRYSLLNEENEELKEALFPFYVEEELKVEEV